MDIIKLSQTDFAARYKPLSDYPIEKAASLYASYAKQVGATEEAMKGLARFTTVTTEDINMATKKKASRAAGTASKKPAAKKAAKKTVAKKAAKSGAAKKPKAPGEKRESAAQLFQDLIREGKLTDDQIFSKVKQKYGLDDSKRSYVSWYRNHLRKQGEKVPDAK